VSETILDISPKVPGVGLQIVSMAVTISVKRPPKHYGRYGFPTLLQINLTSVPSPGLHFAPRLRFLEKPIRGKSLSEYSL
jgi:hypothetical protein